MKNVFKFLAVGGAFMMLSFTSPVENPNSEMEFLLFGDDERHCANVVLSCGVLE